MTFANGLARSPLREQGLTLLLIAALGLDGLLGGDQCHGGASS
jgi:hypothetical protein